MLPQPTPNVNLETWHDQCPTHAPRPEWLTRIEAYAAAAWRDRDAYLEGRETNPGFSWTAFDGLTQTAFRLEDDAEEARLLWLNGYEPATEMLPLAASTPDGQPAIERLFAPFPAGA